MDFNTIPSITEEINPNGATVRLLRGQRGIRMQNVEPDSWKKVRVPKGKRNMAVWVNEKKMETLTFLGDRMLHVVCMTKWIFDREVEGMSNFYGLPQSH